MIVDWIAAAGLAGAAGFGWAVRGRSSSVFGPSVHRGPKTRKAIALTFDDGPSESTPQLLEILTAHNARATFFQCGENVERLPSIAQMVNDKGHEIGNHTYTHSPLYLRSAQFIADELYLAQDAIFRITGVQCSLFRSPYGCRWFGLRRAQTHFGLTGVMWTTLARDWRLPAEEVYRRLKKGAANGAIMCLHDGRERAVKPDVGATIEAVRKLVPELSKMGFDLVTVSELIGRMPAQVNADKR